MHVWTQTEPKKQGSTKKDHESKYYDPLVSCLSSVLICLKNRQKWLVINVQSVYRYSLKHLL